MVASQTSIGYFGGTLRRLICRSKTEACNAHLIRSAQCLTEQATQKALSRQGRRKTPFEQRLPNGLARSAEGPEAKP